jgi:hypothetical protein
VDEIDHVLDLGERSAAIELLEEATGGDQVLAGPGHPGHVGDVGELDQLSDGLAPHFAEVGRVEDPGPQAEEEAAKVGGRT